VHSGIHSHFLCLTGLALVAFVGIGYWTVDPVQLFTRSPWRDRQRPLFRPPGFHDFLLGFIMAMVGSVAIGIQRLATIWMH
jgi:hypothetical protein